MAAELAKRGQGARFLLRDATRGSHERLDAAFSTLNIANDDDYRVFLNAHAIAHAGLKGCWPALYGLDGELDHVLHDLRALGQDARALPLVDAPDLDRSMAGAAYVVAGSHFGKRVLLARRADGGRMGATAYLSSTGTGTAWKIVLQELEGLSKDRLGWSRTVQDAHATFDLFERALRHARETCEPRSPK